MSIYSSTTLQSAKTSLISNSIKRERSSSRKKRQSDNEFNMTFNLYCQELEVKNVPAIKVMSTEPTSWLSNPPSVETKKPEKSKSFALSFNPLNVQKITPSLHDQNVIVTVYSNDSIDSEINMLIYKHFPMENDILGALQKTLVKFSTLKVLRLEFCNLTSEQLKGVKFLLLQNENVTEVSLDGNPINYQNFYILLNGTKLFNLSLKFCKINDSGVSKISDYLHYPSASTLFAIDLASNFVTDEGCKSIAEALKTNRSLTYLSLADNCITDRGCIYIMNVLQKFPLSIDEVLFRRRCNMEYLLRMKLAIEEQKIKTQESLIDKYLNRSKPEKKRSSITKLRKDRGSATSASSIKKLRRKSSTTESDSINIEVPKDDHPYMSECMAEKKEIYCKGNYTLTYINLAYNRITCKGVQAIKEMIKEQSAARALDIDITGISKLILEGNPLSNCQDLTEVLELLSEDDKISII